MKRVLFTVFFVLLGIASSTAKVELPSVVGDNMVLQRESEVNVWGEAKSGAKVTVVGSWDAKSYQTTTDKDGKWSVKVKTPQAGGPYSITISDGEPTVLSGVLIGEVWICSGQSNMGMMVRGSNGQKVENSTQALLSANKYPNIRLFTLARTPADTPQSDCKGSWVRTTMDNVGAFSAVGWFFGQTLSDQLGVPIGLINSSWGGSKIEAWIPDQGMKQLEQEGVKLVTKADAAPNQTPQMLYNGMIAPIKDYTAKGFLWYQGESNRGDYRVYDKIMEKMVSQWRALWGSERMPFYYVEIAPHKYGNPDAIDRSLLVEAQIRALSLIPYSDIVSMVDLGDSVNIHPPKKYEVGLRLALHALANDYGMGKSIKAKNVTFKEAVYESDGRVTVSFDNAPSGISLENNIMGFELAGEDRVFHKASARVVFNKNIVEVVCESVPAPKAVRYCFRNWTYGNLYSVGGIPLLPFRSDDW